MISSKAIGFGLVVCLALVASSHARRPRGNAAAQAFRKQAELQALQNYAKQHGIEPPAQNDTNPAATIRERMQQKALETTTAASDSSTTASSDSSTSTEAASSSSTASSSSSSSSSSDSSSTASDSTTASTDSSSTTESTSSTSTSTKASTTKQS